MVNPIRLGFFVYSLTRDDVFDDLKDEKTTVPVKACSILYHCVLNERQLTAYIFIEIEVTKARKNC